MRTLLLRLLAIVLAATVAVVGWRLLWFQCDDAFINFRYVHNLYVGRGPVWNPEPFLPVEGYTAPLWLATLLLTWVLTGVEPPDAANWLSLAFGLGTLVWIAAFLQRTALPLRLLRWRWPLTCLCLLGIAGNRTFATWLSSGLDSAMYQFWLVGWVLTAVRSDVQRPGDIRLGPRWPLATLATLTALTRPEGLLCVGATGLLAGLTWLRARRATTGRVPLWHLAPFALIGLHLLWRRSYYGEWLPNTYYAKSVGWWPEAGLRYLAAFVFEHGMWVWLLVAATAAARAGPRLWAGCRARPGTAAAAGMICGLVGYYGLYMGGDHFGFRPFAALVPLGWVSFLALVAHLDVRPLVALALQLLLLLASGMGWLQYAATCDLPADEYHATAPAAPRWLRPLVRRYDGWMAWLNLHSNCIRANEHRDLAAFLLATLPPRQFDPDGWADLPIVTATAVGVVGWNLPDIAVLDSHGLNDWVVARNPMQPGLAARFPGPVLDVAFAQCDNDKDGQLDEEELRAALLHFLPAFGSNTAAVGNTLRVTMALLDGDGDGQLDRGEFDGITTPFAVTRRIAHERRPPAGYFEALQPNVELWYGQVLRKKRDPPLRPDDVRAIEREWRAKMRAR